MCLRMHKLRVIPCNESTVSLSQVRVTSQVWANLTLFPFYSDRKYMIDVAFKKEELNKTNKNQSRAFSRLFTRVKFVWIPASSIVTSVVLPCYRIVAKFTKRFKGCYCPSRHIKTLVRTTTDAHYEENGLALFSMSFSRHWCNTE